MDRLACVDVAAFPLQMLLHAHPEWRVYPVVVVEHDRPQAPVLYLNMRARRLGVRSGQRYAAALTLARQLRAGTVSSSQIEDGVRTFAERLRRYSPHVEPSNDMPGVFWLDAGGLHHIYPSLRAWADAIRADLRSAGMHASVAVGFTRFGSYALAIAQRGVIVVDDAEDERRRVSHVALARMNLDPAVRDRLGALGIDTVGQFLRLPAEDIRTRLGAATDVLYRLASGTRIEPLVPVAAEIRHEHDEHFDKPEDNAERLLFAIKSVFDRVMPAVIGDHQAVVGVVLRLRFDGHETRVESIRPAAATVEVAQLLTLVRLRLDALPLSAGPDGVVTRSRGIATVHVSLETCPAVPGQRDLLPEQSRRDTEAANRALARVRAECGDDSVVRAAIRDAHLPSARFAWEPLTRIAPGAAPRIVASRPLVRRILARPILLDGDDRPRPPASCHGPYLLAGGWWGGGEVRRDYYFVRTPDGETRWVYFDHRRRQFFLQGRVE